LSQTPSTYEKGLALELKLLELFKNANYNVIHNAKKVGKSGAEHQIDILAEYRCPLHTSQVVVEAKSYDSPINKDRIMKLIQIVNDIGADHGIIVTTSYFTPDAMMTAKGNNVELWDRERLLKSIGEIEITATEKGLPKEILLKERTVQPLITIQEAETIEKNILERRAKGGFLGKGKIIEKLNTISLGYFPYYEIELQASVTEVEKTGLMSKRTVKKFVSNKICVDALNGDVVNVDETGISSPYSVLKSLNEEEIVIFKSINKKGNYEARNFLHLGYSEGKIRKILHSLVSKGALTTSRGKKGLTLFQSKILFPQDLRLLKSISAVLKMQELSKTDAEFISPKIEASDILKRVEFYWDAKGKTIDLLYYPYYVVDLITQDSSKRVDIIDAINGTLKEI
jgi:hypothetical protein